jgi:hypothetical protein
MGDPIILGNLAKRFFILNDTPDYIGPPHSRNPIAGFCGTWMAFGEWQHRSITCEVLIFLKKLLEFLKEQT